MASKSPITAAALAGILAVGLVSADLQISVQYDATYSLSDTSGPPCSGTGDDPIGVSCPKAGDIATVGCLPYLPSFNGTACVAPIDAQCIRLSNEAWGCAFLKPGYTSDTGETSHDERVHDKGHYDKEMQRKDTTNNDTTLKRPIGVKCYL
ncbi:LOW QUALITY PROTEIN: Cyst germination specific acidic repeat protein precursor [Phytophthora megakarya]|uniref:Cyst germination specific acidic repeat protein n=1 Tax=Phytophthora megakarya TaxID=4795 RepID=A0A225UD94_9STRA|nr:LOW QUALITY PROTEIN: Cyst germination specific acidic repeat protein precursor [Phytophthora megakarya]